MRELPDALTRRSFILSEMDTLGSIFWHALELVAAVISCRDEKTFFIQENAAIQSRRTLGRSTRDSR